MVEKLSKAPTIYLNRSKNLHYENKFFYSVITTLSLALFVLVVGNVTGQTNNYTNNDDAVCGDIQEVASRIATTYHVDVEVVEPYADCEKKLLPSAQAARAIT